jgi:purine nucleosidase/pyrimidine-specific ribonucleoside hydrolase
LETRRVLIDCDAGIDDALNILLALASPEVRIEAITTVSGNVHVDKTSTNVLKVLELAHAEEIPVGKGAPAPLLRKLASDPFSHGYDGLGNTNLPEPERQLDRRHAVELIGEIVNRFPGELTLITTAPLTNIALCLLKDPSIAKKVKEQIMIGGVFGVTPYGYQNATGVTPVSEWNINVDPEAARIVFHSGMPIIAIGNDVTTTPSSEVLEDDIRKLERVDTPITRFSAKMMRFITQRGLPMHLHDPMSVILAVRRDLFRLAKLRVDVETQGELTAGQTVTEHRLRFGWGEEMPTLTVAEDVNGAQLKEFFIERIQSLRA